jgi:hypothetical protein
VAGHGATPVPADRQPERPIGSNDSVVRAVSPEPSEDEVLRAKYLDWCSAKVAERFLRLTPEEIYELAQRASPGDDASPAAAPAVALQAPPEQSPLTFRGVVERVTAVLTNELDLPGFEQWRSAYTADPAQYDDELLGLWRERVK